jgi:N-carbamoyl-L-amino-acid hydrolase
MTPLQTGAYAAFVELHIEQGPILERLKLDIGVVTAIAAPASLRIFIEGEGGHAGAVLMPDRHDAFLAAAEIALAVEAAARSTGSSDTVATCGVCELFPGRSPACRAGRDSRSTSATSIRHGVIRCWRNPPGQ